MFSDSPYDLLSKSFDDNNAKYSTELKNIKKEQENSLKILKKIICKKINLFNDKMKTNIKIRML